MSSALTVLAVYAGKVSVLIRKGRTLGNLDIVIEQSKDSLGSEFRVLFCISVTETQTCQTYLKKTTIVVRRSLIVDSLVYKILITELTD